MIVTFFLGKYLHILYCFVSLCFYAMHICFLETADIIACSPLTALNCGVYAKGARRPLASPYHVSEFFFGRFFQVKLRFLIFRAATFSCIFPPI